MKIFKKECIALNETSPITQLRGVTCHMRSHSVTCHPTQVNAPIRCNLKEKYVTMPYFVIIFSWSYSVTVTVSVRVYIAGLHLFFGYSYRPMHVSDFQFHLTQSRLTVH